MHLHKHVLQSFVFFLLCVFNPLVGQDAHFTQFYNVPAFANPAFVGTSNSNYRVSTIYRDQWRTALEKAVSTFAVSGDLKFDGGGDARQPDFFGAGIMFFSDKLGAINYNTNQIALSGSYTKLLDKKTFQYIGIGIQTAIQQKSINYNDITFGDQFNAVDGYTLPTGEELPANNLGFFDINMGLNYSGFFYERHRINLGISAFHLLSPNISFYDRDEILSRTISVESKLPTRFTLHGSYQNKISNSMESETRLVYNNQGKSQEANLSTLLHFTNPDFRSKSFFVGPGIRFTDRGGTSKWGVESLNATAGFVVNKFVLSFSYENSINNIINTGRNFNAFEVSLLLFGDYTNDTDICPKF